jgi:AraC-like DNA-binding protein
MLLTSKADMKDRLTSLEYGADAYMVKPFNIEELELTIDNLLKNRQRVKGKYSGSFQEDRIRTIDIKSNSDRLMEKIMKVINDNLDNPDLKVEMLAEEVGLSRAQLHRRVKEMTGISTGEFIRNIKLKKAAELLSEKKINISQVAYMLGFSSQTHFSTAFRKFYGISPTEYINR